MKQKILFIIIISSIFIACNGISGKKDENKNQTALLAAIGILQSRPVSTASAVNTINFNITAGTQDAACATTITNTVGLASSSSVVDLRLYIHDVKLVSTSGAKVDFEITTDNLWQLAKGSNSFGSYSGVALLDFENGAGGCVGGTAEMNKSIRGTSPVGDYTGIEFKVGVPFNLNHLQSATAVAPLNIPAMYWSWNSGYKFAKLEYSSNSTFSTANRFHLGSGSCTGNTAGPTNACGLPNIPTIELKKSAGNFDSNKDKISLDLQTLFMGSDGNTLTTASDTAIRTCMTGNTASACQPIISNMGINVADGKSKSTQSAFSIK